MVDPKSEAANETAAHREAMGQSVHVIAPFGAPQCQKYLASYNPLDGLDPDSITIKEDILDIVDGTVLRSGDPRSAHWDDGAVRVVAGLVGLVLMTYPKDRQNLIEVRKILRNADLMAKATEAMKNMEGCGGVCEAAASAIGAPEGGYFVSNADGNTEWLDSPAMESVLQSSSFDLRDLKLGKATVYLVLPAEHIAKHGRFLRLFVRCAITAMQKPTPSGQLLGNRCMFLLDEFFSLGYIDEIAKSAGLMPGYGLAPLWPILQDLGQLQKLYGREGAETFFSNADVHQFFGVNDTITADYVSHQIGAHGTGEIPLPPEAPLGYASNIGTSIMGASMGSKKKAYAGIGVALGGAIAIGEQLKSRFDQKRYTDAMNDYNNQMSHIGKPRVSPELVRSMTAKTSDVVADGMLCFFRGAGPYLVQVAPFFRDHESGAMAMVGNGQAIAQETYTEDGCPRDVKTVFALACCCLVGGFGLWWLGAEMKWAIIWPLAAFIGGTWALIQNAIEAP